MEVTIAIKQEVYSYCQTYVQSRLERIQQEIQKNNESLQSETKSSAGDKHETGRAMLQLEREKLGNQLSEVEKMTLTLKRISPEQQHKQIVLGSLVVTNKNCYYIGISAGVFDKDDMNIYCISTATPIGQLLLGKSVEDIIVFNGMEQRIISVF